MVSVFLHRLQRRQEAEVNNTAAVTVAARAATPWAATTAAAVEVEVEVEEVESSSFGCS